MSERRQKAVSNFFDSMDVNKDGQLTILDLKVLFHLGVAIKISGILFQIKYATQLKANKKKTDQAVNQVSEL
jgi:hypothetical protein